MTNYTYFSQRVGLNQDLQLVSLEGLIDLFSNVYQQLQQDNYFTEAFGFYCNGQGASREKISGKIAVKESIGS